MGSEIKIITFWKFASFKDIFETQEDDNADKYFATNGIPASDHLSIADYDDTAFGAETLTWQDPVHSWKAGPGEVSVCRFKSQLYLLPSSGISIVWRADSWRRRHAAPQLAALQTMEMPLDGDNMKDS